MESKSSFRTLLRPAQPYDFLSFVEILVAPGETRQAQKLNFDFTNVLNQYESTRHARQAKLLVRVTTARRLAEVVKERDRLGFTI